MGQSVEIRLRGKRPTKFCLRKSAVSVRARQLESARNDNKSNKNKSQNKFGRRKELRVSNRTSLLQRYLS